MVTDYAVSTPARRQCCQTGRTLQPGDRYFGVLVDDGQRLIRHDFSPEAWTEAPTDAVGYWSAVVPAEDGPRRPPIDDEMLLECFRRLDGAVENSKLNFRYIVALLLVRRKRLKLTGSRRDAMGEVLLLADPKSQLEFEVRDAGLDEAKMAAVQDEVYQLLGWD